MKIVKKLKPGQLCTIRNRVYRCTKAAEDDENLLPYQQAVITCRECNAVNAYCFNNCFARRFKCSCYRLFGNNCYPKPI